MKIKGKEYGMIYTVGARLAYESWLIKNPKAPITAAKLQEACFMSEAYAEIHGGDVLKMEDIVKEKNAVAVQILQAVAEQEREDSEVTVEAEPKNAKTAAE